MHLVSTTCYTKSTGIFRRICRCGTWLRSPRSPSSIFIASFNPWWESRCINMCVVCVWSTRLISWCLTSKALYRRSHWNVVFIRFPPFLAHLNSTFKHDCLPTQQFDGWHQTWSWAVQIVSIHSLQETDFLVLTSLKVTIKRLARLCFPEYVLNNHRNVSFSVSFPLSKVYQCKIGIVIKLSSVREIAKFEIQCYPIDFIDEATGYTWLLCDRC